MTSRVFRETAATILDEAGRSARAVADQLDHSRPSMTLDVYVGRWVANLAAAAALDAALSDLAATGQDDRAVTDSADRVE